MGQHTSVIKTNIAVLRRPISLSLAVAAVGMVVLAADWPTQSGSPKRDGWARSEKAFTKENAGALELIYKYQADNQAKGLYSLTAPLVNGLLITYRGFKEMLVFSGSSDDVYSVDADLNRLIWKTHLEYKGDNEKSAKPTVTCPGGLTASVAMAGSASAGVQFGRRRPAPTPGPDGKLPPAPIGGSGFGSVGAFFALGSDGYVRTLNPSTGADLIPMAKLLPAHSKASALNLDGNTIYAATSGECGGPNAVYGVDLGSADKKVASFELKGSGVSGAAGTAIGSDGTVYVQAPYAESDAAEAHPTLLALQGQTLKLKDSFTDAAAPVSQKNAKVPGITPLVFSWKAKELIVTASSGKLYLLDSSSLGGADHHTPLFQTEALASAGGGFHGGFSSWIDTATDTRWIYASLWGPPQATAKFASQNGDAAEGSIVAFKVEERDGKPALSPVWISGNVPNAAPAITVNGLVFALATGHPAQQTKKNGKPYSVSEVAKASKHATLFVLDGETGKQLYSSGDAVGSAAAYGGGIAVANGRAYFPGADNTMYSFGFMKMQPQLTGR